MKKFELTTNCKVDILGRKIFQIRALIKFGNIDAGELGGWIEKESNLSHDGNAWVYGNAEVYGNARVYGDAEVSGNADYATIKGFGSVQRNTTFFHCKDGMIRVVCGCFFGTIEEFRKKVVDSYGDNKLAKEYLMIADLMEYHFKTEAEKG